MKTMTATSRVRVAKHVRIVGSCVSSRILPLHRLEAPDQLAQPPRATTLTIYETYAGLMFPCVIDDAARQIEGRFATRRRYLQHDVGADRGLQGAVHQTAADANLAQL